MSRSSLSYFDITGALSSVIVWTACVHIAWLVGLCIGAVIRGEDGFGLFFGFLGPVTGLFMLLISQMAGAAGIAVTAVWAISLYLGLQRFWFAILPAVVVLGALAGYELSGWTI